jgi:hypothetical protein
MTYPLMRTEKLLGVNSMFNKLNMKDDIRNSKVKREDKN